MITPPRSQSSHTARSQVQAPISPPLVGRQCSTASSQPASPSPARRGRRLVGLGLAPPLARTQLHISLSNSGSGSALWRSGPSQPAGKSSEKMDSTTRHNTDKHKTQLATQEQALPISRIRPIHVSESRKIDIRKEKSKVEYEIRTQNTSTNDTNSMNQ